MDRMPVNASKDKKVFRNVANKIKSINLSGRARRGGIRL